MRSNAAGVRPWVVQRLSAVFMVLALSFFCLTLITGGLSNSSEWRAWFSAPLWSIVTMVFWLALFMHAWIGVRDVIMDYVSNDGLRFTALAIFGFYLIAMTVWMMKIMIIAGSA